MKRKDRKFAIHQADGSQLTVVLRSVFLTKVGPASFNVEVLLMPEHYDRKIYLQEFGVPGWDVPGAIVRLCGPVIEPASYPGMEKDAWSESLPF